MLRELEKAAAAFAPVDDVALRQWPVIATGNWGCGAFAPGIGTAWGFHMGFFFGPKFSKIKFVVKETS